jgi:translation elongation factor EF-Ts
MRGFICAMYTIAHIIQQQTVAVMTNVRCNRLVEGPLLKQILVHIEAMMPTTANIRDVTTKAMSDPNERDILRRELQKSKAISQRFRLKIDKMLCRA